ncbi:MAG: tRNA pseudouridine(13) synthase TruD [Deltaproteobacteria bacterium]|nr:tRNA pseudouridine(13) synthase TruD [Deltaproteobacteria bacterium]MBW2398964.1 tRNA pseudouridine(13) synthase TruD [Deltaproteobacteria bacterium]
MRSLPEDFCVDELPLYRPSGSGDHTFLHIEKRLRTTEDVAHLLARFAGARTRDVGYAGRKDRVALTTQWYSVPGLDPQRARELEMPGVRVLDAIRHGHKLRTGHLSGNRFRIFLREVDARQSEAAIRRLEEIRRIGMPNRFGVQRFGRDGENAERGRRLLRGERSREDRRNARFLLSALQAEVFNAVLEDRTASLDTVDVGEVAMVHASGGCFVVEDLAREAPRAAVFEISATGPIFGTKVLEAAGEARLREHRLLERFEVLPEDLRVPRGIRLRGARRALRVRPGAATAERYDDGLLLRFSLPPGSYATVLIEEILDSRDRAVQPG